MKKLSATQIKYIKLLLQGAELQINMYKRYLCVIITYPLSFPHNKFDTYPKKIPLNTFDALVNRKLLIGHFDKRCMLIWKINKKTFEQCPKILKELKVSIALGIS